MLFFYALGEPLGSERADLYLLLSPLYGWVHAVRRTGGVVEESESTGRPAQTAVLKFPGIPVDARSWIRTLLRILSFSLFFFWYVGIKKSDRFVGSNQKSQKKNLSLNGGEQLVADHQQIRKRGREGDANGNESESQMKKKSVLYCIYVRIKRHLSLRLHLFIYRSIYSWLRVFSVKKKEEKREKDKCTACISTKFIYW